jgi:predicted AAA+ superfamily ATPase
MDKSIKRDLFPDLEAHLSRKEITLITGPRQTGKTTLMKALQKVVESRGIPTLFLTLDLERDKEFFVSQAVLIKKLELAFGDKRGVAFLDEIQRKENVGLFLKGIYDMGLPYKLVVSGSGSVELKEKIHESLMGRKRVFELPTVSFREFVNFITAYRYDGRLDDFFLVEKEQTLALLSEYMSFGGYPRVIIEKEILEKRHALDEIYQSYVEKDLRFLGVEKLDTFSLLLKLLSSQIGNITNYTELSRTLQVSIATVKNYLWYIEQTYVAEKVTPYFRNIRKEISKSPLWYFIDCGMRNYSLGVFGNIPFGEEGFLFENVVFQILKEKTKNSAAGIHFWRTLDKAEVDFVVEIGLVPIPVEVKYKIFSQPTIERSLRNFIEKYAPPKAFVVNKNFSHTLLVGKTQVFFVPFSEFVRSDFLLG